MFNRLIIFLFRLKFGVKKNELFRFSNQKSPDLYYFTSDCLLKIEQSKLNSKNIYISNNSLRKSGVPLNWLLDKECKVVKWEANKRE